MRDDDGSQFIEFVVSEDGDGPDEELAQPIGFPRLRKARLPLFVAAADALIAVIAVNVANGPSGSPSAARQTVTVSPSTSLPVPPPDTGGLEFHPGLTLHVPPGQRRSFRIPDVTCPSGASCAVTFATPKSVLAAIRRQLPNARKLHTVTTTFHQDVPGSRLLVRQITGRIGTARLVIDITRAGLHDALGSNAAETASQTIVTAGHHVDGRLISARLTAPPGAHASIYAMGRLVADSRLTDLA